MSTVAEDLTFNKGDIITIVKEDGEWWTGTKDGQTGTFPANYVKKLPPASKVTVLGTYRCCKQGERFSGKSRNVGEFDNCPGKVRKLTVSEENVRIVRE